MPIEMPADHRFTDAMRCPVQRSQSNLTVMTTITDNDLANSDP